MKCIEKVFTYWPNNLFTNQNEKNMDKKVISNGGKKIKQFDSKHSTPHVYIYFRYVIKSRFQINTNYDTGDFTKKVLLATWALRDR